MLRNIRFAFSTNIGFIGTGAMGAPMAQNLANKGYKVFPFDNMESNLAKLQGPNINRVQNLSQIAQNCDKIIIMLPNQKASQSVFDELKPNLKKGSILFEASTIEPQFAKHLQEEGQKLGLHYIDGPVSGGVIGATNGTLTFMVGSSENEATEQMKPVLQAMGKNIYLCGAPGTGQIAKMCNNLALGIQMASICEAMYLGKQCGIDQKILYNIMNVSTTNCWSLNAANPAPGILENSPSSREYKNGFALALMIKDMNIAKATCENLKITLPVGDFVRQNYEEALSTLTAGKDFGILYETYAKRDQK